MGTPGGPIVRVTTEAAAAAAAVAAAAFAVEAVATANRFLWKGKDNDAPV